MTRFHFASTRDPDMLYLVQRQITDPFFFLEHEGQQRIFLSRTDIEAFQAEAGTEVEAVDVGPLLQQAAQAPGDRSANLAKLILEQYQVTGEVFVPSNFPYGLGQAVSQLVRLTELKSFCRERGRKSPTELVALRENAAHTKKAFALIEEILTQSTIEDSVIIHDNKPLTSEFLKREVSKLLLEHDLVNTEGLIVSCAHQAAMPHHGGSGPLQAHQTIIVDIFPQSSTNHYFADMTRTYVKGEPSAKIQSMYTAVSAAKAEVLKVLKPGASTRELYELSAQVIRDHGFHVGETGYTHSLGHGLGVAVHEAPSLSARSTEVLAPGHVVTIEPGVYYLEIGGVRIEDTIVVTETSHENLTNYPENWLIPL
ncbi:Xaa-Pro peptidase family protein [Candidatus Pacebacteria bacterium]|nr:Xaa-Pro peptidase family protein [Candidatus Paceibacterota bacterium]